MSIGLSSLHARNGLREGYKPRRKKGLGGEHLDVMLMYFAKASLQSSLVSTRDAFYSRVNFIHSDPEESRGRLNVPFAVKRRNPSSVDCD